MGSDYQCVAVGPSSKRFYTSAACYFWVGIEAGTQTRLSYLDRTVGHITGDDRTFIA
jgi:non-canonical (house-cleaning) NTP pyrophosphatase